MKKIGRLTGDTPGPPGASVLSGELKWRFAILRRFERPALKQNLEQKKKGRLTVSRPEFFVTLGGTAYIGIPVGRS